MAQFPDVPTLTDLGYKIEAPSILGIAGPKDLPEEAVQRLDAAIKKATESEELQAIIDKLAMQMTYRNSADFEQNVRENYETQGEIIRAAGLGK